MVGYKISLDLDRVFLKLTDEAAAKSLDVHGFGAAVDSVLTALVSSKYQTGLSPVLNRVYTRVQRKLDASNGTQRSLVVSEDEYSFLLGLVGDNGAPIPPAFSRIVAEVERVIQGAEKVELTEKV